MNPFQEKSKPIEKIYKNWKSVNVKPYDKETVDPYTRVRVILMNGTEFEAIWNTHRFSRHCTNNDVRRAMAMIRRGEQQQQKRVANLKPRNESALEHTIGYEQLAVDLTAILAQREKNEYVKHQLDFALLEDFDHLYRYADLLNFEKGIHAEKLVGSYTEIMPGRPTVSEPRHPYDDVRFYINNFLNDPTTRLNVGIITAAEQQTMNYYLNIANQHDSELGRKLYSEIAMIEEQHVTGYGCLSDPTVSMYDCMVMHEYTECYLYWSCYEDEKDPRVKDVWLMHFEEELSHLRYACELLEKYDGKVWQQLFPEGGAFPELIKFTPQKEYVREVLKSVRLSGNAESFEEVDRLPDRHRFFSYNREVQGNVNSLASHMVIEKSIKKAGRDYRFEEKAHPIRELKDEKKDNTDVARIKGA
ncbi:MAG TPA: hypothetical protein H9727_02425 [Candidatus Borkfalkia avistercoris]|uniref:Ferritin-like domain-containing protein n=1 Tax=Candidatus Borkfalkia avistercoris TaxID=2838504 RepID=A0A9D2ICD1_9FIRM|nr:hypothetical protein [Candidatus Borkfalkia avistercoris]